MDFGFLLYPESQSKDVLKDEWVHVKKTDELAQSGSYFPNSGQFEYQKSNDSDVDCDTVVVTKNKVLSSEW